MATFEETLELAVKCAVERAVARATEVATEISTNAVTELKVNLYPVGSYYITESDLDPSTVFEGTWVKKGQGRCLWGADDTNKAGTVIAAGLPDITGTFNGVESWGQNPTGSFYLLTKKGVGSNDSDSDNNMVGFAASRSNSIYGRSTTVQPPALAVNIWVRTA